RPMRRLPHDITYANLRVSPNNSHSGTHSATLALALHSSSFFSHSCALFCSFLHPHKTHPFSFHALAHSLDKTPGVGVLLSPKNRQKPRLGYTLLSGGSLGSRQKYPAHPHRPVSHRQSSRRQSRVFRPHARVSSSCAPRPGASGRSEQFYLADSLVPHRHPHSAFIWNLHSRRAGWRRPDRHFQWLDYAEEQGGNGPRPRGPEKSESQ